jgi:hypothetical protein
LEIQSYFEKPLLKYVKVLENIENQYNSLINRFDELESIIQTHNSIEDPTELYKIRDLIYQEIENASLYHKESIRIIYSISGKFKWLYFFDNTKDDIKKMFNTLKEKAEEADNKASELSKRVDLFKSKSLERQQERHDKYHNKKNN